MAYSVRRPFVMHFRLASILALSAALLTGVDARTWKSADGAKSFEGEFVKRELNSITINKAGEEVTIDLGKLHEDDKKWVELNHPIAIAADPEVDPNAVFDTLTFADNRETALKKLKESKVVEMTMDEAFIGRSGLNGIFRTRKKIGKVTASLYFDWTDAGKLKELTLQTDKIPADSYESDFGPSWSALIKLMSSIYGTASTEGPMPSMQSIPDGSFLPSHFWKLENGCSALLGTAREGKQYQLVVRFTEKKVEAVEIP